MNKWAVNFRFKVILPKEGENFPIKAKDRFDARNKAVEELNKRFKDWERAYIVDGNGDVLSLIYNHNPTNEEIAVANLVYELGDVLSVPFFEWLLKLVELMGDAPHWNASYDYPSHSVEVDMDRVGGVLRVTVWEQGEKREAEVSLD